LMKIIGAGKRNEHRKGRNTGLFLYSTQDYSPVSNSQ
jgi:hypothetical protein